jgi:uncharacterized protein
MSKDKLLIIFARNPALGRVKTRLAKEIGDEKALQVYLKLLEHTHKVADEADCTKHIYYTDNLDEFGLLDYFKFKKFLQHGNDLGDRMMNAVINGMKDGFGRIVIIGSDCIEISSQVIEEAFTALEEKDCVLGPASDGGYYLIGMKEIHESIFTDKKWSSEDVFLDTMLDMQANNLSYHVLKTLNDIDTKEDLDQVPNFTV